MIRKVVLRRFKRFTEETFEFPGHVVLAGPNNTGKTTVLQAIAAWSLALSHWQRLKRFQRYRGAYVKAPIARQAFSAVPLRVFELLWNKRGYKENEPVEIEIQWDRQWQVTMELIPDSTEQIYVRPKADVDPKQIRAIDLKTVYVPPMSGLSTDEPVYQLPKQNQLLGQGKPGDIIRNLLVEANNSPKWDELRSSIKRLFEYEILPPNADGPDIIAEYKSHPKAPQLDIASAGSGFQQVLMLLTFLHTRPASVLLLDEPDAHLHVILQDAIYSELRSVATRQNSQLIIATHSEVIINSVEPEELCQLFYRPRMVKTADERARVAKALGIVTNTDIMQAENAPGVLFIEGRTDLAVLQEWARILGHPAYETLMQVFWRPTISDRRLKGSGINTREYYDALKMIRDDLPGLELIDSDGDARIPETAITGRGLQRIRWRRY